MLQSISIENFRCFQKSTFSDFQQFNLFAGKNNSGKTALLEAIYVLCSKQDSSAITDLYKFRKIDYTELSRQIPDRVFDTFFYKQNKNNSIYISTGENLYLPLEIKIQEERHYLVLDTHNAIYKVVPSYWEQQHDAGNYASQKYPFIFFLPTDYKIPEINLVKEFEGLELDGKDALLLKAFQLIDPSIEKVKSFTINPFSLYLKRKDENYLPLGFFGDAMNKMAHYILHLIKAKDGILLIDEIENGIHFTYQQTFWEMLFTLAKELNVQIFATTHSGEMIEAYKNAIMEKNIADKAVYFELFKHVKTDEIVANKIPISTLAYKIENHKAIRGE